MWRFEGPRVKVKVAFGFPVRGPAIGDQHLVVTAHNVGRAAVGLTSWGFDLGNEQTGVPGPAPGSTPLPHTLDGGHEATFLVPLDGYRDMLRAVGLNTCRVYVGLATGTTLFLEADQPSFGRRPQVSEDMGLAYEGQTTAVRG